MFGASVRTGFRVPSCGLIGVLEVWGFRVSGLWIRALGLGFEASSSREVGIGGMGVRRSGLVVRHIDFRSAKHRFTSLPIPKVNCLRSKIVFSV